MKQLLPVIFSWLLHNGIQEKSSFKSIYKTAVIDIDKNKLWSCCQRKKIVLRSLIFTKGAPAIIVTYTNVATNLTPPKEIIFFTKLFITMHFQAQTISQQVANNLKASFLHVYWYSATNKMKKEEVGYKKIG